MHENIHFQVCIRRLPPRILHENAPAEVLSRGILCFVTEEPRTEQPSTDMPGNGNCLITVRSDTDPQHFPLS